MHVKPEVVRHAAGEPTAVLLAFGRQRFLDVHRQQPPVVQALRDHAHAGVMDVGVRGARLGGLEAGLLGVQHRLVEPALEIGELAVGRERAGDVGRVQAVDLHTGIDEQHVALAHDARVAHPVQNRRVLAGGDDRIVAQRVALLAGHRVERAFEDALGARLVERFGKLRKDGVEAVLGGLDGLAHLSDLVLVLDHAGFGGELVQLVVGCVVLVRVGIAVGLTDRFDQ